MQVSWPGAGESWSLWLEGVKGRGLNRAHLLLARWAGPEVELGEDWSEATAAGRTLADGWSLTLWSSRL